MKLDSTNMFLSIISLAMFSVTSVLVGVLVCVPTESNTGDCDPLSNEIQCPEGRTCSEYGRCVAVDITNIIAPQEACLPGQNVSTCHCPPQLEIVDEICQQPASNQVCEHAEVAQLLARLSEACSDGRETAPGRLEGCSRAALRDVVIGSHRNTLKIAEAFREQSFTLHFARGTPRKHAADTWPTRSQRSQQRNLAKGLLEQIEPRGYLLLIALASATGTSEINYDLATRRSDTVVALISEARNAFPAFDIRLDDIQTIIGLVGYEQHAALTLEAFDDIWGRTGRYHAWDDASTARMKTALTAARSGAITHGELEWLTQVINQSVLVIPLPCAPPIHEAKG